jgi:hypothetical protein
MFFLQTRLLSTDWQMDFEISLAIQFEDAMSGA